jgi:hypothetical protein
MGAQSALAVPQLGELLRFRRQERGKSQLDLLLLFFDYNSQYTTVRHCAGAARGMHVSDRD